MDPKGRGRGRGRTKLGNMRVPDKASLDRVNQEKALVATTKSGTLSPTTPEQMADPPPTPPDPTPEQMADLLDQGPASTGSQEQGTPATSQQVPRPPDGAKTTTGEGQLPPLVEDLKKALQKGLRVPTPSYSNTVTITAKLNPAAANFVPKSVTVDPNSSALSPFRPHISVSSPPIFTKHSIPTSTSSPSNSQLNPTSKEFVPSGILPSDLPGMVPQPSANGDPSLLGNGGSFDEEELDQRDYLSVKDIMQAYEKAAPTRTDDLGSEPVLKGAAEMLLKASYYPGSFDEIGKNFQATLSNWLPSDSTLVNLAEMLVYWGVCMPDLRYTACRMSELIAENTYIGTRFGKVLIPRLQAWHSKCYDKTLSTDEDKYLFAYYSGFFAEIFSKIRFAEKPVEILCPFILKYVETLLSLRGDFFVREACNILKLTGSTLVYVKGYDESKMVAIVKMMNELAIDKTLSETCTSLIMQVVELSGSKWTTSTAPIKLVSNAQSKKGTVGLNTNAVPFVPSDPMLFSEFSETFYDPPPIMQPPVSCAADWDDFVGEDQPVEASDNSPDVIEDDYDGLDPDIELEMEAFIDEIEEHLMLQDFDPELQHDNRPGGKD